MGIMKLTRRTSGAFLVQLTAFFLASALGYGADVKTLDVSGIETVFVRVAPGEFMMGSELSERERDADERRHKVRITREYWLAEVPVTVAAYRKFVDATGYETEEERASGKYTWRNAGSDGLDVSFNQTETHPVVLVSWRDAQAYVKWLNENYAPQGMTFKLPTEAQWEYACRAGGDTTYWWGDDPEDGKGKLNAADASAKEKYPRWEWAAFGFDDGAPFTAPVGSFTANAWGLKDMSGNVWEWCEDIKGPYPTEEVDDPTGASEGTYRVVRGGGWDSRTKYCRSAHRGGCLPDFRYNGLGFRVALVERDE